MSVVTFTTSTLRDVPTKLRELAASIEAGEHGYVSCCAVVLLVDTVRVFGYGDDSAAPMVAMVLRAGAAQLEQPLITSD